MVEENMDNKGCDHRTVTELVPTETVVKEFMVMYPKLPLPTRISYECAGTELGLGAVSFTFTYNSPDERRERKPVDIASFWVTDGEVTSEQWVGPEPMHTVTTGLPKHGCTLIVMLEGTDPEKTS